MKNFTNKIYKEDKYHFLAVSCMLLWRVRLHILHTVRLTRLSTAEGTHFGNKGPGV